MSRRGMLAQGACLVVERFLVTNSMCDLDEQPLANTVSLLPTMSAPPLRSTTDSASPSSPMLSESWHLSLHKSLKGNRESE